MHWDENAIVAVTFLATKKDAFDTPMMQFILNEKENYCRTYHLKCHFCECRQWYSVPSFIQYIVHIFNNLPYKTNILMALVDKICLLGVTNIFHYRLHSLNIIKYLKWARCVCTQLWSKHTRLHSNAKCIRTRAIAITWCAPSKK